MKKLREDEIRIATEAARWQQALAGGDEQVRAEFTDWLKASPRHVREFMFMEALDAAAVDVDPDRALEMATDLSGGEDAVVRGSWREPLPPVSGRPLRGASLSNRQARGWAAAAVLVCVLAGGYLWLAGRNTYVTDIGEQRSVRLPDGSMMHLNTDSRAIVKFSDGDRAVRLESGEALFKVERDAKRPFEVLTPSARIRVLGTEFNVRESGAATRVAVVDGAVQVRTLIRLEDSAPAPDSGEGIARDRSFSVTPRSAVPPSSLAGRGEVLELRAGDEANVDRKHIVKTQKPNIERAISWRARRLVFQEESLGVIAEEFNRYNRAPRIVVEGGEISGRRYGGTFNADDPQSLVRLVTRTGELLAEQRGDEVVIRAH